MDITFATDTAHVSWQELAFRNSLLKIFAFDGDKLVGAGRGLSDGVWRAAIYDVAVLPEYQGKGIGSDIIRRLVQQAGVDVVMLYAAPGSEAFYRRFGFNKLKTAMAIFPDQQQAHAKGFIE